MKNIKILIILLLGLPSWIECVLIQKKDLKTRYHALRKWCRFVLWLFRYKLEVSGLENMDENEVYFIASNHQDSFDPAIIISASPYPISFISKKENEKLILFGKWAKAIENIHFDRESREDNIFMLRETMRRLKNRNNILIFPEGTRSKSSKMNEFKAGSLTPGSMAKVPILPIVIDNSYSFSQSKPKSRVMKVKFLKPIQYEEYKHFKKDELTKHIENLIKKEISALVA